MKKLSAIVLSLILMTALWVPALAVEPAYASIDTSATDSYFNPGDDIQLVISLCDIDFGEADGVSALEMDISYNGYMVTPTIKASVDSDGDQGDFGALLTKKPSNWEGFGILDEDNCVYKLAFSDISGSGSVVNDGELVITIPFKASENVGVANIVFSFENVRAYNANMEDYCDIKVSDVVVCYSPQPNSATTLPSDAIPLDIAGYKHDINNTIYYTSRDILVRDYVCKYMDAAAGQETLANYGIIIVGADGVVSYCDTVIDTDKSEVSIPAGSYIIAVHKDSEGYADFAANADVGRKIELYNLNVKATATPDAFQLTNAGFVIGDYAVEKFKLELKPDSLAKFSADGKYLFLFQAELSVDEFKSLFVDNGFDLLNSNGNLYEKGLVGTGKVIAVGEGITVVLIGDVNCDGKLTATDYLMLKRVVFSQYSPSEAPYLACCIRGNDAPTASDYLIIKKIIFGSAALESFFSSYNK